MYASHNGHNHVCTRVVVSTVAYVYGSQWEQLFALFSSMCEQKVSAYMPSWALLVMTAVW
jgi:hypothetical protein